MASSEEICKAFFNLEHDLNRGHSVITSIYSLVKCVKEREELYFESVDDRIERACIGCKTIEHYEQLLKVCWSNIDNFFRPKWVRVAYVFYVTQKIDSTARNQLPHLTYLGFKDVAEVELFNHLKTKFGNTLSTHAWDTMHLSKQIDQKEPPTMSFSRMISLFAIAYTAIDIYNKL